MPVHQCMRNLSWSSSVSFTQVCRSLAVLEVLAPRAQPCCALGSWCPCVGDPPGLSWARLLPSCCGELCLSPQQYIPLHPSMTGEDREVVYTAHHPLRSACSPAYAAGVRLQREQGMECGGRSELSGTCHSREVIHPHVCRI